MKVFQKFKKGLAVVFLLGLVFQISLVRAETKVKSPQIEVVFVLDTTGSMGGLIEGAKQKIWSIANEITKTKVPPHIKFGLVGYRDRGDAYVTKTFDLTEDLDTIYSHLEEFQADGGGDTPESVNQALHEAVTKTKWSVGEDVLRLVFLVGDAPPKMNYQDDVKYQTTAELALQKDIIINTILCGESRETQKIWKEIAMQAKGDFAAIPQNGGVQAIATPMDVKLAELNQQLSQTALYYGSTTRQHANQDKVKKSYSAKEEAQADRLSYNSTMSKSGRTKVMTGSGDLVDDLDEGLVKLTDVKPKSLPKELQGKTPEEQKQILEERREKRNEIQQKLTKLLKEREAFIRDYKEKHKTKDAFDEEVKRMIHEQAKRKGIVYI